MPFSSCPLGAGGGRRGDRRTGALLSSILSAPLSRILVNLDGLLKAGALCSIATKTHSNRQIFTQRYGCKAVYDRRLGATRGQTDVHHRTG